MRKEEMLLDGQDEPVTSMPVLINNSTGGDGDDHHHHNNNVDTIISNSIINAAKEYGPNDPVMNAPSH
jgi:hypothetical protein